MELEQFKIRALANEENAQDDNTEAKLLGLRWNGKIDTLKLQEKRPLTDPNENVVSITKRDVLRASSKIYDPLGLITPITIRAKTFLQELWELKYAWDEPLPKPLIEKWVKLSTDLEAATQTEVQRRYFPLLYLSLFIPLRYLCRCKHQSLWDSRLCHFQFTYLHGYVKVSCSSTEKTDPTAT
jgi:hypothetical protein